MAKSKYNIYPVGETPPFRYAVVDEATGVWVGELQGSRWGAESFIRDLTAKDEAEVELDNMGLQHRMLGKKEGQRAI